MAEDARLPAPSKLAPEHQMTIEEFLAFTDSRPDEEKWELIEGMPVVSPSPTDVHQLIVASITGYLWRHKVQSGALWFVLSGTGTRVPASKNSLPQPDIIVKESAAIGTPVTNEAVVIFEVLSRSNTAADRAWRRRVYTSVPNCQHYVTISMVAPQILVYDRAQNWKERIIDSLAEALDLPALGLAMPLADVYRWTPLGSPV